MNLGISIVSLVPGIEDLVVGFLGRLILNQLKSIWHPYGYR